jgi:hypothetical protein
MTHRDSSYIQASQHEVTFWFPKNMRAGGIAGALSKPTLSVDQIVEHFRSKA